jgi:hypothetical protein
MKAIHYSLLSIVGATIFNLISCKQKDPSISDLHISDNNKTMIDSPPKSPNERLFELVGTWSAIENSFIAKEESNKGTMNCSRVANGHALSSSYRQGSGDSYYEADALWGYSETTKEVKVFEVNSLGAIDSHNGYFDSTGLLIISLHDNKTHELLQHRIMSWNRDTLKMEAAFLSNQDTIRSKLIMTRQRTWLGWL